MHRLALPLLFLSACAGGLTPPSEPQDPTPRPSSLPPGAQVAGPHGSQAGQPIGDDGHVLLTDDVADRLAQAGGWVRLHLRLGPYERDTPAFYAAYDAIVARLRGRGLQIVGLLSNESWRGTQDDWTANNWERQGGDGYNAYIDQFGYLFARVAAHYEGQIRRFEIWNEPNCWSDNPSPGEYRGCSFIYPSNFAALLAHCHSQAHYYNHLDVQVISGGLFGHDLGGPGDGPAGVGYLDSTYDAGINHTGKFAWARATYGSYPLDGVGQHIYIDQGGAIDPGWFGRYLDDLHDTVSRWEGGDGKPTWVTEYGWTTASVDPQTQARNLRAALGLVQQRRYVHSALWFQLDDNPAAGMAFGLFGADGSPKPALAALQAVARYQGRRADGSAAGAIAAYFDQHGGMAQNGSPYDNGGGPWVHEWDFGEVQDFSGGSIGTCAVFDTGHRVAQGFWQAYLQGDNHHRLRFPTSDEYATGPGTRQDFQGGSLTWDPAGGVQVH